MACKIDSGVAAHRARIGSPGARLWIHIGWVKCRCLAHVRREMVVLIDGTLTAAP
jgi:hypothetical protein